MAVIVGDEALALARVAFVGMVIDDPVRERIDELTRRLQPNAAHSEVIEELQGMFVGGKLPDPPPDGFLAGRMLTISLHPTLDRLTRRVGELWMPWMGKSFDIAEGRGVNVLTPSARGVLRALWPSYEPVSVRPDAIEAFAFDTRTGPGELDPSIEVMKIDYDINENPTFVVRNVLDELVQIDTGLYLGKALYRRKGRFQTAGFFTLSAL